MSAVNKSSVDDCKNKSLLQIKVWFMKLCTFLFLNLNHISV